MSMTIEEITEEALTLPREARALLANKIIESLDSEAEATHRDIWASEALRRRDEVRSGKVQTIPGEEALVRVAHC